MSKLKTGPVEEFTISELKELLAALSGVLAVYRKGFLCLDHWDLLELKLTVKELKEIIDEKGKKL